MATISLKISLDGGKVVKTIQFDPTTTVYDACRIIREKILEANASEPKEFGLFLASDDDPKKGIWLEASRSLDYYMLHNLDVLEYSKKTRNLRVRMLDGTVKTLLVDDSQIVANLMVVICTKIGITNYDEYGLVREEQKEEPDPCEKPNYGTLTLRRKHHEKERDAKMEQLRKKLRTDDEVNWVEPAKTLREQGIDVSETLLLRRKLFFSDRNVDSRDPVQLNLLYVQARDAILDGTHPVTQQKACEFAGIQCQIQFGDHKEDKHTAGFLDLKEFLPASEVKVKGIEKKVFKEHRKHAGLSELDAKVLYTKSARDLKTYGVAFFLVKEKMKGKNKLVPRLLGVTKDSVLRLDEKTKEILQTWPLTTVRRWCASPNTFTLDFGDYSDQYYSVQTTEAEQILQVIAGYIDIIVRKQRAKDHLGIEGDEGSAMLEDSVSPSKANIIQHDTFKSGKVNTESVAKPAVHRPGAEGAKPFAVGHMTGAQQTTVSGQIITGHAPPAAAQVQQTRVTSLLSEPQRALLGTITSGREVIERAERSLTRASIPELSGDAASVKWKQVTMDTNKQAVTSQIAAMNAATAQVVTLTSGPTEEVDHTAVGAAITTITTNLPEMTRGVQMIAALMEDDGDRLLDATRKLCSAFSDLLTAAEPETKEPRQSLLNAASRVGEASTSVLHTIGEETEEDKETQDILLALAKAVANTTAALVLKAKNVAAACRDDQPLQNNIIAAATNCALATSQLVACAKVVAPTLHSQACREQVVSAARAVASAVEKLLEAAPAAAANTHRLPEAAKRVTDELDRLLAHCTLERHAQATVTERTVESVMSASERVVDAGDAVEMVRHARLLGQATAHLITNIKTEAESQPSDSQRKLLAAAKLLADATARMVEAARQCASSPQDRDKQEALRKAAEEVRYITADYAQGQDIIGSQVARLQESARQAASSATQMITCAQNASQYVTNKYSQETLMQECRALGEQVPRVVDAVHVSGSRPAAAAAHLDLISASETFLQASGHVVAASRGVLPTMQQGHAHKLLADSTHRLAANCADLRSAVSRARISCKGLELDAAAEIIRGLQAELDELEEAARAFELRPLPGQTEEWASSTMRTASRSAAASTAQLVSAARLGAGGGEGCGRAGCELATALRDLTAGVRAATALHDHPPRRDRVISSGRQVLTSSLTLVETVKTYLSSSEQMDTAHIVSIAKDISDGLEATLEAVPSQTELDVAMENINETLNILNMGEFPPSDKSYGALQTELSGAAVELSSSAADVVGSVEQPAALGARARGFGAAFNRLLAASMEMAGQTEDHETQTLMVSSMKSVTVNSSKLLSTAKSVSQDLTRPNAKNQLAAAARAVTDSINRLVDVCTEAAPGQKECEAAIRSIASTRPLLGSVSQPVSELSYIACRDCVVDQSKGLSEGMSGMASAVKRSEHEQFARSVGAVAAAVTGLVECTAQAAYLVAISDETSVAGRPGLVDQAQFARASAAIEQACRALTDPASNQQQVLSAATVIAKHTSALCNACRVASGKTAEPQAKRHFVQAAKDVANSTAALVKDIKALDADYSESNRSRCAAATGPLQEAVRGLCQFADSPEFASVPARISAQARAHQEEILECGRSIITGSCAMLEAAKALALAPQERAQWQQLAAHSKTVSDSIKALVTNIRDKTPGVKECTGALEALGQLMRELDAAAIAAVGQELAPRAGGSWPAHSEQVESSATEMLERLEPLRVAANGEAENLGHAATQLVSYAEAIVSGAVGLAPLVTESRAQAALLQHTRTVLETCTTLLQAARDARGNPRAVSQHAEVNAATSLARAGLGELGAFVRELSAQQGAVGPLLESLARCRARLTENRMSLIGSYDETDSFVDYQARMIAAAKDIARLATDMTAKAATDASKLVQVGNELVQRYEALAQDSLGAAATTPNADVANSIRGAVVELGECASSVVRAGGACRLAPGAHNQRDVAHHARQVNEKVISVLSALQACSRGTQACIDAASTIAAIIGDLDTTILFASAGTLHSERADAFADHRETILKTAKALVEDTKTLVGGAAGEQDQLAAAANSAVSTIVQLCEVVKQGAMSLGAGSAEPQVLLLHAARDVAAALRDLAAATTAASGKHHHHPDMQRLKHAAKVMVTNVTSLLKTVKAVEDEHTRGTRALESTIEAISQEIEVLLSDSPPKGTATAEELVRCTRQMTTATARAVAAGNANKQDQLTAAANLGRKTVQDLLVACKAAAYTAESVEVRTRTIEAGAGAAGAYRALLAAVLTAVGGAGDRHAFPDLSRRVAHAVADIIAAAEVLKGSDWVDPADPTVIAESELLGAAASIDAAARKLDALRPRRPVTVQETDENMNFDEMILQAAKSIIAATSALVRAASTAQRELIDQGKVARRPAASSDDGQWSEGLVSAARLVAAAAHALVEAANALVQGAASEERLISSARQVAASTAQLLVACKVKADPTSESTRRLQAAGAEVIRSTDGLVRAARDAIHCEEERSLVLNRRMVGGIAQEIDARSEVLRIEKELEEARGRLTAIRQAKYKLRGADTDTDTDTDHLDVTDAHRQRFKTPNSSFANTTYSPNSTFSQHNTTNTINTTNVSHNASQLNQSIHGAPYQPPKSPFLQTPTSPVQNTFASQSQTFTGQSANYTSQSPNYAGQSPNYTVQSPHYPSQSPHNAGQSANGYQNVYSQREEKQYSVQSPTFSSFRPQEDPKQNYEGFTTRSSMTEESVVVRSLALPEVRTAVLVGERDALPARDTARLVGRDTTGRDAKRDRAPPPPPRRVTSQNYETRLYDTPRPVAEHKSEEQRFESSQYHYTKEFGYDAPKASPMSPKFNARELKFDEKPEPIYSSLKKSKSPFDGVGQTFSEHQVSTEAIPGGTKHSEFSVKSESYQSYPKTEFIKTESRQETKSPFATSTPSKMDFPDYPKTSTELVKAATPDYDRISSPYGKETQSYGGPNYMEETTTEVKEIPNGTQKITTTKIYSSSPVNITSTNTKYEPIKLEGIDELSKSFDNESKYSTLDSRFNTLESKMSSDTSRSFMRPSEFQSSDYQTTTNVTKVKKPADLAKELDSLDKKFSKQTITSETIERKSVMTSSHKSESSSTVTKKFGNF